ncbi:MAG TPA: TonB-dependent receptor [Gemmatimonadaceae bacterium]|nr:TonB-dependent receptor [Gemmatimonadaceae bacterium]
MLNVRRFVFGARAMCVACALVITASTVSAQKGNNGASVLEREITLSLVDAPLGEALMTIRRVHGVPMAWSGDALPASMRVTLSVRDAPLGNTLTAILAGSGLDVVVTAGGTVVIVPRRQEITTPGPSPPPAAPDARANPDVARALAATGVQQLDRVIVIGSPVQASPEREQPTAVAVVQSARIAELSHARATDVMRTAMPGVVFWDRGPIGPPAPVAGVRGVASFTTRALKTYVDGIELASPDLFTLLDGRAISRIEMIRGPQGAALYGPDALNGILRIETSHGAFGAPTTGRASASGGVYDRSGLPAPEIAHDVFGGLQQANGRASYDASASFAQTGIGPTVPLARTLNGQAGARLLAGPVVIDASVRGAQHDYALERASLVGAADRRSRVPQTIEERAVALSAVHQITGSLRETLVAGVHWIEGAREPFRSPVLPPRLPLGATHETAERASLRYSITADVTRAVTLSGGAEASNLTVERAARRATTTTDLSRLYSDETHAAGAFAQARVRLGRLVVSGGARGERLSEVGDNLGTVWASTAGASWSHELSVATIRVRAAWGSGIKPPEAGMAREATTDGLRQAANDELAPERQRGVEGGIDVYFASGPFIRVTAYNQRATDLIQQVLLRDNDTTRRTYQYQNVGVIRNRGVEFEGGRRVGAFTASASMYLPRSEVVKLAPRYSGEFQPGDALVEVPEAAGALSLRYENARVQAELGATVLGPWTGYDWIEVMRVELGQATARDAVRDYWMRYPGVIRPYITGSLRVSAHAQLFVRVDNPANSADYVRDNLSPTLGRLAMIGIGTR